MEVLEGRRTAEDMLAVAEPIDGPYIQRFQYLARELRTCLCFGFAELIGNDVYNAAIFIDSDGEICGKYHKTQFAEGTHPSCNFNRIGATLRAFDTPIRARRIRHLQRPVEPDDSQDARPGRRAANPDPVLRLQDPRAERGRLGTRPRKRNPHRGSQRRA